MYRDSSQNVFFFNSVVEPEGVQPSRSPLPLLVAPEPGIVVAVVTVAGARTRSRTRRAAAILQSHNRHPSGGCLAPESSYNDRSVRSDTYARQTASFSSARDV